MQTPYVPVARQPGSAMLAHVATEAAEKAYQEAVANLRVGEVVRVRDAGGTLLLDGPE